MPPSNACWTSAAALPFSSAAASGAASFSFCCFSAAVDFFAPVFWVGPSNATAGAANAATASNSVRLRRKSPIVRSEPVESPPNPGGTVSQPHYRGKSGAGSSAPFPLFDGDRLGEIARLVDVRAHDDRRMVGEELHRHGINQRIGELRRG